MASGSNLKSFLHSASGTAFVRFILFAAVLAAGIAWGVHWLSLQWFTDDKRQEAVTALQLVDAFVADYADVRAKLAMGDAPVPASFRAHAIQRFNAERLADDSLRLHAVGRKERAIATPPMDAAMAETIEEFARDPAPRASFVPLGDALMFRIVSPSLATQQSCVDCHNKLQPAGPPWRLGDVMGAFFVDVPASQFLARNRAESVALGLALFLALGGAALFVALLHFRQQRARDRVGRQLAESEQRFRDFAEASSDWFWEQDENFRFVAMSDASDGSRLSQLLGRASQELLSGQQAAAHRALLETRRPFQNFRYQRVTRSGRTRHISVNGKPIFDAAGTFHGYRGTARDVTAEIANEIELARRVDEQTAELRVAQQELLAKERLSALGQLTATVAHELRNPLSAIRNSIFAVKEALRAHGLTLERPLFRIDRGIARCDGIITDLLDFTRLRELKPALAVADDWLAETLDEQKLADGVALERALGAPGVRLSFDPERLRRVLVNLVDNAAQALAESGDGRDKRIIVETRVAGDRFELAVRDNGPGIAPDVLPKVFEPLFSTKSFGTGLGLPMVKRIVEQHGGSVEITSAVGVGTTVRIRLPLPPAQEIAA